jgi:hypothetical protein
MCLVCIESGKSGFRTPKQIDGTVGRSLELGQTQAGFRLPNKLFTSTMWSVESRDMSPLSPPRDCFKCTSVCGQGWQGVLLGPPYARPVRHRSSLSEAAVCTSVLSLRGSRLRGVEDAHIAQPFLRTTRALVFSVFQFLSFGIVTMSSAQSSAVPLPSIYALSPPRRHHGR